MLLSREVFEALVDEAINSLPDEVQTWLDNVAIVVADRPSPEQQARAGLRPGSLLFGLYEGVPKTKRGVTYGEVVPDKILIFQRPTEMVCRTPAQVRDQVRRTVLHEIGHHLGMDEEELEDSGY
ncbi:MAG: metallopeptidase family protein [Anaerolineae bacterium]|nr:metallopeptidase family protein [Anaerolineae bacterium]